jgi:hypothetical protein
MTSRMTRREFVQRGALLVAALPVSQRPTVVRVAAPLRIGVVTQGRATDEQSGIDLGIDEARRAASLFGGAIEIASIAQPSAQDRELSALIGGGDACASWAAHASDVGIIYLNVGCTNDDLRAAKCSRACFHIIPSAAMYRDAIALVGEPQTRGAAAWDASLSRFGADTLNQRFRNRFGRPMASDSWAAWMGVKILWESSLRTKATDPHALAAHLERDTTQFDGHKGQPLSFRTWDHQLRQPVYVVTAQVGKGAAVVREVPEVLPTDVPREALDRIGTLAAATSCRLLR